MIKVRHPIAIEHVFSLAEQGVGRMTKSELKQGWQRLASRLAEEQHLEPAISLRSQAGRSKVVKLRAGHHRGARLGPQ